MSGARIARWIVRAIVGLALLLVLAAAGLWWWAGQDGSLAWVLQRVGKGGPLVTEGVHGSIRNGWHIDRIAWERDGLRLEAEDIRLDWQPLALLNHTLQLEQVQVARARVIDRRPPSAQPLQPPASLRLPWRVQVQHVQVAQLAYRGRFDLDATQLAGQYAFDGLRHRVQLESLQVAGGNYRGELSLLALPPLTLDASLAGRFLAPVPGARDRVPLDFQLRASGPATAIDASARLQVARANASGELPQATATARITPFAAMPVPRGSADFRRLDLALFWPAAPHTALSGHVGVQPAGKADWQLQADVRNADAGPWDAQRLPVTAARAQGEWRNGQALVRTLRAEAGGGVVEGSGAWADGGWRFDGRVDAVDPAQLHTALAPLPLTGPLKLASQEHGIAFDVDLKAGAPRKHEVTSGPDQHIAAAVGALDLRDIVAQGRWSGDVVSLAQLRVHSSDASLEGHGQVRLAEHAGDGELALQAPGLQVKARGSASETAGQGSAEVHAPDLAQARRWLARWPGLGARLKSLDLRGDAQAQLAWQGGWRDPTVQARASAHAVAWQAARDGSAWTVQQATLQVQGKLRDAALQVDAQAQRGQRKLQIAATGRLGGTLGASTRWRGRIATLRAQWQDPSLTEGPWLLQLQRAVDWQAAGGNLEVSAGEAVLQAPTLRGGAPAADARVAWGPVHRQRGVLTTTGTISGLPMAWIELFGGSQFAGSALSGDMVFDARWNAQLGPTVRVDASLARVRGDVNVLAEAADGTSSRVAAGVRDARLTLASAGDQLVLSLLWDSERAGHAQGQIRTRLSHTADGGWSWPEQAPLAGSVQAQLPRIGVWSLLAPPGWRLRGSLDADIAVAGTRAQPRFSGPIRADGLALRSIVDGVELRNGSLRAQLAGDRLVVDEFILHGSDADGASGGTLVATGEGSWTPAGPQFRARATLSQLHASIRSDRELIVSGSVDARMDKAGTAVTGQLVVDRARIRIPEESPPRLGEDVIVHDAAGVAATDVERRMRPAPSGAGRTVTLRVSIDLGPDFRLAGRGVDTRLAGSVQVEGDSLGVPQIVGVIHAEGGTYRAYGEQLQIERGELRFTGAADNPAIDVLAIRPNLDPKVGVQITGRAQAPHVELYSESGLSEAETLSYLVLGRSSAGGGTETALLQRAATAFLAGRRGNGKGIAGSLGLDDLQVRSDSVTGPVVRVGKRFAQNFYAAYERSLSGAMGTLFIFYDLSKRITVRGEAGERSGVDLIFTFTFDHVRKGEPRP